MTKDYDEYKAEIGKHKTFNVFLKIFSTVITVGCIIVGILFLLMVAFPRGLWVGLFEELWNL